MNSFKQALNLIKYDWRSSLLLGLVSTAIILVATVSPLFSSFFIALSILIIQEASTYFIINKSWRLKTNLKPDQFMALVATALLLIPTSILLGSALGLLQSPQQWFVTTPLSLTLLIIAMFFYFVLSHALRLHLESKQSLMKSFDSIGLGSIKNFRVYLTVSFYSACLVLFAGMTKGVGLIVVLPLILFVNHFSFLEVRKVVSNQSTQNL